MWEIKFIPETEKELSGLDGSLKRQVLYGIVKVSQNPLLIQDFLKLSIWGRII
ncbi:MAG TPA: hypothetical protein GX532_07330 [Clostridia bacterium]|jgi:hypothetical protein|nr:hypothetical protein [Clostridia bacterium]HHY06766.1 hypothetical protein [Clostridia bacterium]